MKRLGFAIFAVVLGLTVFAACNKKETPAPAPATEVAPAPATEVAPATEAAPAPATEVAPAPPTSK